MVVDLFNRESPLCHKSLDNLLDLSPGWYDVQKSERGEEFIYLYSVHSCTWSGAEARPKRGLAISSRAMGTKHCLVSVRTASARYHCNLSLLLLPRRSPPISAYVGDSHTLISRVQARSTRHGVTPTFPERPCQPQTGPHCPSLALYETPN